VTHTILFGVVVMNASVKSHRERERERERGGEEGREREGEYIKGIVSDTLNIME
jgi:hypothetical protein